MNESEHIVCKQLLGKAISNLRETQEDEDEEIDIEILSKAARMLRKGILSQEKWNFSGSFDDFETPGKLECFIKWLLVGPKEVEAVSKRDISAKKAIENLCQIVISSVVTDRQRTYNAKTDNGLRSRCNTPLSVGLALNVYMRTRSKALVDSLHKLKLSSTYTEIMNIERRLATGVFCKCTNPMVTSYQNLSRKVKASSLQQTMLISSKTRQMDKTLYTTQFLL